MDFNTALGLRHFAVLTTVAELSAARAVGASVLPATVTVHLLSRARLAPLVGKDRVLRKGKRLAVAEGEVTQNGEVVAKAIVQFALLA